MAATAAVPRRAIVCVLCVCMKQCFGKESEEWIHRRKGFAAGSLAIVSNDPSDQDMGAR